MSLQILVSFVIARISAVLLVPAIGSGVWTYYAYEQMIEPMGWGLRGRFIAALGAIMASTLYWVGGYALITLVPRFGLRARLFSLPIVSLYAAMVIATSSAPQVILFHAPAREAEMRDFVAALSRFVDGVKFAVAQAGQLEAALEGAATAGDSLAALDEKGGISGVPSVGIVVSTTRLKATEIRTAKTSTAARLKDAEPLIQKIDAAFASVREAAKDSKLDFEGRRLAFEKQLDVIRTATIALSQIVPLTSLQLLAKSLQSDLIKPMASAKSTTKEQQGAALAQIEGQLRRMGKDLQDRIDEVAGKLQATPPIYQAVPASELIFTYAHVLLQAWSLSLGIDLFSLVLLALACIGEDETRRQSKLPDQRPGWLVEAEHALQAARDLEVTWSRSRDHAGALPYPAAAQARLNGKRAPRPDNQDER